MFIKNIVSINIKFFKNFYICFLLNRKKTIIYYLRFSGILNSLLGKKSWYRPKIKINDLENPLNFQLYNLF